MKNALQILAAAQAILARYLPPDGITEHECISELLTLLDSPSSAELTRAIRDAQDLFAKRKEAAAFLFPRAFTESSPPLKNPSGQVQATAYASADADARDHHLTTGTANLAPDMSSPDVRAAINAEAEISCLRDELIRVGNDEQHFRHKAARLENELAQVRKHETHLIQERDRLIHQDLAKAHTELQTTKAALASRRNENKELINRMRQIATYAKATAGV